MNPNTGELRALRRGEPVPEGFEQLPRELDLVARLKMQHSDLETPARVNLRSGSPLAQWAKKKRKAKIAAASRRRNRK